MQILRDLKHMSDFDSNGYKYTNRIKAVVEFFVSLSL